MYIPFFMTAQRETVSITHAHAYNAVLVAGKKLLYQ